MIFKHILDKKVNNCKVIKHGKKKKKKPFKSYN